MSEEVDIEVKVNVAANCLHVYLEGNEDGAEIEKRVLVEVFDQCRSLGLSRVLVEKNLRVQMSAAESFELGKFAADQAPDGLRMALYDRVSDHFDVNSFGVLVANNRGLDAKAFSDIDEAKRWLSEAE